MLCNRLLASTSWLMLVLFNCGCNHQKQNDSPSLSITPLQNPVLVGEPVSFQAQGKNLNEKGLFWDFGDNSKVVGDSVKHTFSKPGIYSVFLYQEIGNEKLSSAIVRVHTPESLELPQVFLDTDARNEADDQHFIAYALYSGLDILGINSIHNDEPGSEAINYGEIFYIQKLMDNSRLPWDSTSMHRVYHGAATKLEPPSSGLWSDTKPIITAGSEAILAAARGAWPGNPVWILPVGPCTNIASALLQAREEGFELRDRIRVIWLGGGEKAYHTEYNGGNDPWSVYVMGQSDIDLQILLGHPTSLKLNIDKRIESDLYPDNELGEYLETIIPVFQWGSTTVLKSIHDACVLGAIISAHKGYDWIKKVESVTVSGPDNDYLWQPGDSASSVQLIWDIDGEAMKQDLFNTLNGQPTSLFQK